MPLQNTLNSNLMYAYGGYIYPKWSATLNLSN